MSEIISTGIERHSEVIKNPSERIPSEEIPSVELRENPLPQSVGSLTPALQSELLKTTEIIPQKDNIWDGCGYAPGQREEGSTEAISSGDRARDVVAKKISQVPVTE